nr:hypothetical protein [Ruminococcus sp. AF42-10]
MAEFKSLADLFKSVNKDIDQALDSGVSDYVTQVAIAMLNRECIIDIAFIMNAN